MFYRCLAILLASCLPTAAAIFPMGPAHTANAVIAGTLGTVLAAFALTNDRARLAAALVGFWVALSAFVFWSTLLEEFITVSWGVLMFVWMIGPLSVAPRVTRVRIPGATPQPRTAPAPELPMAA
jgi:hypothetical protein